MPAAHINPDKAILSKLLKRMKSKDRDPLGPLIDRYYLERNRSPSRLTTTTLPLVERPRPGGRLSPSNMGGCKRAALFKFVGMRGVNRTNPDLEAIFQDGNWRHFKWGVLFQDMELVLGKEVFEVITIEGDCSIPELRVAGSYDVIIRINGNRRYVVDFKGINDVGFQRVINNGAPLDKHIDQVMTYMEATSVPRGILLYENKNNNLTRCFVVKPDDERWDKVVKWAESVVSHLERRRLPAKDVECSAGSFLYERCPYASWCYGDHTQEEITKVAFRRFKGTDEAWDAGHEVAGTK